MEDCFLAETALVNYSEQSLQELIGSRGWQALCEFEKIDAVYRFVRDEIPLGYNRDDALPASQILKDGYGQCNTKGILLTALLRATGIPCRIHGFYVKKELQKGLLSGISYRFAPGKVLHSWIEILFRGKWLSLEGYIVDRAFLSSLQKSIQIFNIKDAPFCGYAVAVPSLAVADTDFKGTDTYIQKDAITEDLGVFDDPDSLFRKHRQPLSPLKRWIYRSITRKCMNRNAAQIRGGKL